MASTAYVTTEGWDAANCYTAAADVDVLLTCTSGEMIRWSITTNATPPSIMVGEGHILQTYDRIAMTLSAGERLWLAGRNATATLED